MSHWVKRVQLADTVLDCIPIVSSISNAAQAMYKLAHKVDALNPVAPGLKTSMKIHVLSKDNFRCFAAAIPILGNMAILLGLILRTIRGMKDDDHFMNAVLHNNREVVHLCLGNKALNDSQTADAIFCQSAHSSNNAVFKQILSHKEDWSAKSLMQAILTGCWWAQEDRVENAHSILDYCHAHGRVLSVEEIVSGTTIIKDFLKKGKVDLAARVIEILPQGFNFSYIEEILSLYSCCQYDYSGKVEETGVLREENRNALIAKSEKPSPKQLEKYLRSIGHTLEKGRAVAQNYRAVHFSTLNKLLDLAKLQPNEMGAFISSTFLYDEFALTGPLIEQNWDYLTAEWKEKILNQLIPCAKPHTLERSVKLFEVLFDRWKSSISAQPRDIARAESAQIENSQKRFERHIKGWRQLFSQSAFGALI